MSQDLKRLQGELKGEFLEIFRVRVKTMSIKIKRVRVS